jgi:hypothetical protein
MKIFWSWQADTPGKTGRFFVRDALQAAIDELKEPSDVEEPTSADRREALHLDHDRKGERGSPDLARTIFKKIDASTVVVADVTAVASTPDGIDDKGQPIKGKKLINSNAAIELGYALRAVTDERVLQVFNAHYGKHEDLPFDLRHKAGAIVFDLPPDATKEAMDTEAKKLKAQFVVALRPYLLAVTSGAEAELVDIPHTFSKAAYFKRREILAQAGVAGRNQENYVCGSELLGYLRLKSQGRPIRFSRAQLKQWAQTAPLLYDAYGGYDTRVSHNDYGAIHFRSESPRPGAYTPIIASTQLFLNGEMWAITSSLGRHADFNGPLLHPLTLETLYYKGIRGILTFATNTMGLVTPFRIECGLAQIRGAYIKAPESGGWMPRGPIRDTEVIREATIYNLSDDALNQFLLGFFEAFYDSAGEERPKGQFQFPPGPPRGF